MAKQVVATPAAKDPTAGTASSGLPLAPWAEGGRPHALEGRHVSRLRGFRCRCDHQGPGG
jgi:hypothetical protein